MALSQLAACVKKVNLPILRRQLAETAPSMEVKKITCIPIVLFKKQNKFLA